MACLGLSLAACSYGASPDNPNYDPSRNFYGRARHWTVKDASNGSVLLSGCNHDPLPILRGSTPTTIVYDVRDEIVEKAQSTGEHDWWCSNTERLSRRPADTVEKPACWQLPVEGPILVNEWEIIPAEGSTGLLAPEEVEGRGFQMRISVSGPGTLELEPVPACAVSARKVLQVME